MKMYLRMLKKDLKEKVSLNIILCIFMILACTLLTMSTAMIYMFFAGTEATYEKCNTSDMMFYLPQSISDEADNDERVEEYLRGLSEIDEISVNTRPILPMSRLHFEGVDNRSGTGIYNGSFVLDKVSSDQNIPYDLNDEIFALEDGCVAVPQDIARNAGIGIGDTLQLTTDLGNIYEFVVSHIFKTSESQAICKFLFADADFEKLMEEFPVQYKMYNILLHDHFTASKIDAFRSFALQIYYDIEDMKDEGLLTGSSFGIYFSRANMLSNERFIVTLICTFMAIMGALMIFLTVMTIRFSLTATIKREEKEIGMMKAIGVDSLAYKSLFIVKYMVFAVLGGVVGLTLGIPLSHYMINRFAPNLLNPEHGLEIFISILTALVFIVLMILFSFASLKKMDKISVMDIIHGENRGERFRRLPGIFLHRKKKISVPLFLAVSDVMRRIKRYGYLILSYTFAIIILLLITQLKSTIISDNYRRTYWTLADWECMIKEEDSYRNKMIQQEGSYRNVLLYYEKFYNEHGIPLNIQMMDKQYSKMIFKEDSLDIELVFGDYDIEKVTLVAGGKIPKLENEVAVSHRLKNTKDIQLGDTITVEYRIYGADGFTEETVQKDFIVTAYVENLENGTEVFMTKNQDDIVCENWDIFNEGLDVPDSEYAATIEKMRSLSDPDEVTILDYDQLMENDLGMFKDIFDMLIITLSILFAIIISAQTFLYQQIFIEEEASDVAMLKSLGIDRKSIRGWHIDRILILIVASIIMAVLLSATIFRIIFERVAANVLTLTHFSLDMPSPISILAVSGGMLGMIILIMIPSLKGMDYIKIWKVRNE